jgi:hypothetical protein
VNEIEQAWTGVDESDRAIVSHLVQSNHLLFILVCPLQYTVTNSLKTPQDYFWALPTPVLSVDDIVVAQNGQSKSQILTWNIWSKDPIKKAVIVAIASRLGHAGPVVWEVERALTQKLVCSIHSHSLGVNEVYC